MNTYYVFNTDQSWVKSGGYGDCLAIGNRHCQDHPDDEVSLVRCRAGESSGCYIFRITNTGYRQVSPPKFIDRAQLRRLYQSSRGKSQGISAV